MSKSRNLALLATLIWMMTMTPNAIAWTRPHGICDEPMYRATRDMPLWQRQDRSRRLIECVFDTIAPTQTGTAIRIASRESGLDPYAYNASGCAGLFQHMIRYWPGRVSTWLHRRAFPNTWPNVSPYNGRANAIVAARMVLGSGWAAWAI